MTRQSEHWQTSTPGAFMAIGDVSVWALGEQRFRVDSPSGDEVERGN